MTSKQVPPEKKPVTDLKKSDIMMISNNGKPCNDLSSQNSSWIKVTLLSEAYIVLLYLEKFDGRGGEEILK